MEPCGRIFDDYRSRLYHIQKMVNKCRYLPHEYQTGKIWEFVAA